MSDQNILLYVFLYLVGFGIYFLAETRKLPQTIISFLIFISGIFLYVRDGVIKTKELPDIFSVFLFLVFFLYFTCGPLWKFYKSRYRKSPTACKDDAIEIVGKIELDVDNIFISFEVIPDENGKLTQSPLDFLRLINTKKT